MEIKDNVFIVTGGASGLGAGTARMLTDQGAKVIIADLQDEAGQALAKERSEEHTSELQSRGQLVCRLLLEKKKKTPSKEEARTTIQRITSTTSKYDKT